MSCESLLEAEPSEMLAKVTFKIREDYVRHQTFPFMVNAKTHLLLNGFLPDQNSKFWVHQVREEVAELIKL